MSLAAVTVEVAGAGDVQVPLRRGSRSPATPRRSPALLSNQTTSCPLVHFGTEYRWPVAVKIAVPTTWFVVDVDPTMCEGRGSKLVIGDCHSAISPVLTFRNRMSA